MDLINIKLKLMRIIEKVVLLYLIEIKEFQGIK
jgi:hypothetical protein